MRLAAVALFFLFVASTACAATHPLEPLSGEEHRLAYDLGLLDTDLPFAEAKARHHINARALRYADDPAFSALIRRPE